MGIILLGAVGALDYNTGPELSFSFFYLIPIMLITLATNWKYGMVAAFAGAGVWLAVDLTAGPNYSNPLIPYWNALIRLLFFLAAVVFMRIHERLQTEIRIARKDFVTGVYNPRYFHEIAQAEIERSARYEHPLTIVFIDIDNFKRVNDLFGHSTGDRALATVAARLQDSLRKTDIVARVGGDEFAILMPETSAEAAETVVSKLQANLLAEMQKNQWPITLSIGALTFTVVPTSTDEMLNMADQLMYTVKNNGKNNIRYGSYPGYELTGNQLDPNTISLPK
jgi:diguanylate cyclase (GGDEF)-like protein